MNKSNKNIKEINKEIEAMFRDGIFEEIPQGEKEKNYGCIKFVLIPLFILTILRVILMTLSYLELF